MYFAYPLPWWALAAILLLLAALAIAAYARARARLGRTARAVLTTLRFVTLTLLVLFLLRPVIPLARSGGGGGVVAVLVDTSRSMGLSESGVTRLARAKAIVRDRLVPDLARGYRVEVLSAGDHLQRADLEALAAGCAPDRSARRGGRRTRSLSRPGPRGHRGDLGRR